MEGIWAVLRERLDSASFVPRLVPDVERAELRRRDGSTYYVLKNPRGGRGAGLWKCLERIRATTLGGDLDDLLETRPHVLG